MIVDYTLPGSVLVLKFLFRLSVGQAVSKVEFFKAALNFPVDIAFLAISFAAIILPYMQSRAKNPITPKELIFFFVIYVVVALVVTILSRGSDKAFVLDKNMAAFLLSVPAYFLSIMVIVISLQVLG